MKKKGKVYDFDNVLQRLVSLEWVDSQSTYGWREAEADDLPCRIKTVGILVSETKKCMTISSSMSAGMRFTDKLTIPKEVIKKITRFSLR